MGMLARPPSPDRSLQLLAGMTPREFMRRHWQRRPLLVRSAIRRIVPPLSRSELFALAARDDVESRLVRVRNKRDWSLTQGPIARSKLPPLRQPGLDSARARRRLAPRRGAFAVAAISVRARRAARRSHDLVGQRRRRRRPARRQLRRVPAAGAWASGAGASHGVTTPHSTSARRSRCCAASRAEQEFVLEPGDLLYLPPGWAHEGVAVGGDCMTCSIGMRAPKRGALAAELVQRLAETYDDPALYRDARQPATASPAAIPAALARFCRGRRAASRGSPRRRRRALGEVLSEPKPHVWFTKRSAAWRPAPSRSTGARACFTTHGTSSSTAKPCPSAAAMRRCCASSLTSDRSMRAPCAVPARPREALLAEWLAAGWLRLYGTTRPRSHDRGRTTHTLP